MYSINSSWRYIRNVDEPNDGTGFHVADKLRRALAFIYSPIDSAWRNKFDKVPKSSLLLIDEPSSSLDKRSRVLLKFKWLLPLLPLCISTVPMDEDFDNVFLFGLMRHDGYPQQLVEIIRMIRWHEKRLFKFVMAIDTKDDSKRLKKQVLKPNNTQNIFMELADYRIKQNPMLYLGWERRKWRSGIMWC